MCCEFAINNARNQATGSTPFFLNFCEHPRSPISVDVVCKLPAADTFVGRESVIRARVLMLRHACVKLLMQSDVLKHFRWDSLLFCLPKALSCLLWQQ